MKKISDYKNLFECERMARGSSRTVFSLVHHPDLVMKVCEAGDWSNVREWEIWDRMRWCAFVADWLAPCEAISDDGTILIQARTRPIMNVDSYPLRVPSWATDLKYSNMGMLKGRPVFHDYASNLMLEVGATRRMKKAKWENRA